VDGSEDLPNQRALELLHSLVAIPSPSGQEGRAAAWLVEWMAAHGLDASLDAAGNAVGTRGAGPRQVLLLGHIDTFPGDLPVRRDGDWLYGRGTVDAKGPLCAFAAAAAELDVPPGWRVTVVGAVEEEAATSRGARHLLARWPAPAACVIGEPSGWERITLGYKGRLLVEVTLRAPFAHSAGQARPPAEQAVELWNAVVAHCAAFNAGRAAAFDRLDPTLYAIATQDEGAYGTARLSLGFRLPPDVEIANLKSQITNLPGPRGAPVPATQVQAAGAGKSANQQISKSATSNFPRPARRSRGGQSPTSNLQPPTSNLQLPTSNFQSPPSTLQFTFSGAEVAFRAEKNTPLVRACLSSIRGQGGRPRFVLKTGTSDMNVVGPAWGCPIVAYGPGDSALDHTPEERVSLREYLQSIEVLKAMVRILAEERM
jgi:LysW-gamma-L-lysine carboxypeptidase